MAPRQWTAGSGLLRSSGEAAESCVGQDGGRLEERRSARAAGTVVSCVIPGCPNPRRVLCLRGTGKTRAQLKLRSQSSLPSSPPLPPQSLTRNLALGPRAERSSVDAEDSFLVSAPFSPSGPRGALLPSTSDSFAEIHPCLKSIKPC